MAKEKFILVSLKDNESKKLAQIVSNDSSRKILDYLAEKEATESELSERLGIPLSTIHYNLQALVKGKLVEADEFHYSEKGKEVLHYKIANKYIIIAPKSTFGLKEKLKSILPACIIVAITSFILSFQQFFTSSVPVAERSMKAAALDQGVAQVAMVAKSVPMEAQQSALQTFVQSPASWFLIGCVFTLLLIIAIEYINYKRNT